MTPPPAFTCELDARLLPVLVSAYPIKVLRKARGERFALVSVKAPVEHLIKLNATNIQETKA